LTKMLLIMVDDCLVLDSLCIVLSLALEIG
jgi:hypothetical protein